MRYLGGADQPEDAAVVRDIPAWFVDAAERDAWFAVNGGHQQGDLDTVLYSPDGPSLLEFYDASNSKHIPMRDTRGWFRVALASTTIPNNTTGTPTIVAFNTSSYSSDHLVTRNGNAAVLMQDGYWMLGLQLKFSANVAGTQRFFADIHVAHSDIRVHRRSIGFGDAYTTVQCVQYMYTGTSGLPSITARAHQNSGASMTITEGRLVGKFIDVDY